MGDVLVFENVTSDGIEPPLSDLESEVLPLHHEASALNINDPDNTPPPGFEPGSSG